MVFDNCGHGGTPADCLACRDERIAELEAELSAMRAALRRYTGDHLSDEGLSPIQVQNDLDAIAGDNHAHVATGDPVRSMGGDPCRLCGHDLRHPVHQLRVRMNVRATP